ncbi:hypothetical protein OH77DRAFT_403563 [Trametes cingulata]|nr:hypothetical protein OH77DRAFT_403563 [Trametes cingulata]
MTSLPWAYSVAVVPPYTQSPQAKAGHNHLAFIPPQTTMSYENEPLPEGWVREFDPNTKHPFWVDTRAKPPRSIWVHPYEDEQFLREHPDIRDRLARERRGTPSEAPPPYSPRRHSYSGTSSGSRLNVPADDRPAYSQPGTPGPAHERGFFGKLKDKAIGTKEEREAKRQEEIRRQKAYMEQLAEQRRRAQQQRTSSPFGGGLGGYSQRPMYSQPVYAAPMGNPWTMGGGLGGGGLLGGRRYGGSGLGGFGGGGIGMPLLAGAAGGLLLGDILDGPDYGYGGGWGGGWGDGYGGGFDGGGFDGGFDGGWN